jgi:hypothetical protein
VFANVSHFYTTYYNIWGRGREPTIRAPLW